MANVFIEENILQGWADTVREKTGTTDKMLPSALLQQTQDNWGTGSDITLIEGMEIALDFSAGDQSLSAQDGYAVKSATIKKPMNLIPKNIAKDVDVAGVIGTLESGGGGDEWGLSVGFSTDIAGLLVAGSYGTYTWREIIPSDATNISAYINVSANATDASGNTIKENFDTRKFAVNPVNITSQDYDYGTKRVTLVSEYLSYSGATYITGTGTKMFSYTMPNLKIVDNILYANAYCTGIFYTNNSSNRAVPFYLEGVDLRGSSITGIREYAFANFTELKKVWLPEVLTAMNYGVFYNCTGLEEVHFTSETPPSISGGTDVFKNVPATCKIYVPAGALSAYTSAKNYPSASTYTYIEE